MSTVLIIVLAAVIIIALFFLFLYNSLVTKRNRVDESWSDIDVQLKRRHDLIPNIIESVKAYAKHEKDTFLGVTQARANAISAQQSGDPAATGKAENMLSGALKSLFAVAEQYPALQASNNFLQMQTELTATEDKIAAARRFFNGLVRDFNTTIQRFPAMLIAGMMGFKMRNFFEMAEEEKAVPSVKETMAE